MNKLGTIGTLFAAVGLTACTTMSGSPIAGEYPKPVYKNGKLQLPTLTAEEDKNLGLAFKLSNCLKHNPYKICHDRVRFSAKDMGETLENLENKYGWQYGFMLTKYKEERGVDW